MNLVQINERLKDLPMQVLQQYANGMNPEVPPYLALGELQRREISQKQMATAQGGQQGPQPSVKEQVEQKAGLMALQQMQQQQAAQQMQQPRGPMPAPAGVPQPEMQPQAMMARGGLAGIPVRRDMFEYAGGGIIAFQSGGSVEDRYQQESQEMVSGNRVQYSPEVAKYAEQLRAKQSAADNAKQDAYMRKEQDRQLAGSPMMNQQPPKANEVGERLYSEAPGMVYTNPKILPPTVENVYYDKEGESRARKKGVSDEAWNKERREASRTEQQPTSQGPGDVFAPRYPQSGLPAAAKAKATPVAGAAQPTAVPRPAAPSPATTPQAGLPAALAGTPAAATSSNPYEARLNQVAMKEPVAPTTQDAINRVNELSPASMQEAALQKRNQEMRDRAAGYKEQFEKSRPSGLDDLIRVFGQAGQYKGGTGLAPAYTANQQQKRAEELAMTKQYNELMNLADTKELEGGKELFKARTGAFDTAQQLFGKEKDSVVKATASLYETTQSRINNELKMLSDKEIKMLEIEQRERERKSLNARDPNAKVAEYVGLKAKARELREKGGAENIKQADRLMAQAADIMEYKGGSGTAGVGAVRNAISERRLEMAGLEKIMKDEAMIYSDEEKREAAKEYRRLALLNSKESGGSPAGEVDKTNPLLK
jgi:hypothetical protein